MVEGAERRQPDAEPKLRQSQRESGRVVQAKETAAETLEKALKIELAPDSISETLESYSYKTGQTVERIGDDGILEKWRVASFNPDENEVFVLRVGDQQTPPSLEVVDKKELALEEATRSIAIEAGKLWEGVVRHYVPDESAKKRKAYLEAHKKRLILRAAYQKTQSDESLTILLGDVIWGCLLEAANEDLERDTRHRAAEKVKAEAEYYSVRDRLRNSDEQVMPPLSTDRLLSAKVAILGIDRQPNNELSPAISRKLEEREKNAPTYAAAKEAADEAWRSLRLKEQSAQKQLHYLPENSFQMLAISEDLEQAFKEATLADLALNTARMRVGSGVDGQISKDEYMRWMEILRDWRNKPGTIAARKESKPKTVSIDKSTPKPVPREPVFVDRQSREQTVAQKPSRVSSFMDKLTNWFGL